MLNWTLDTVCAWYLNIAEERIMFFQYLLFLVHVQVTTCKVYICSIFPHERLFPQWKAICFWQKINNNDRTKIFKYRLRDNSVLTGYFDTQNQVQHKIAEAITAWHRTRLVACSKNMRISQIATLNGTNCCHLIFMWECEHSAGLCCHLGCENYGKSSLYIWHFNIIHS